MEFLDVPGAIVLIHRYLREREEAEAAHRLCFTEYAPPTIDAASRLLADFRQKRVDATYRELIGRLVGDYKPPAPPHGAQDDSHD